MPSKNKQEWTNTIYKRAIERTPERQVPFETSDQNKVDPVYTPDDIVDINYQKDIGFPGEFPYTRGIRPTGYRGRLWTMRQYGGFGTAEESNERYKLLLAKGQTGLSVAFDLPTQIGYNSDDSMAEGEVGKVGVAIDSIEDMEILFHGIPLKDVSTSMTINATGPILTALYAAVAKRQGANLYEISGTTQNDILKEFISRGTYAFPPVPSLRLNADTFVWCKDNLPKWNTISVGDYHMREAGGSVAQTLAFMLKNRDAYFDATLALYQHLTVDDIAPQFSYFFSNHNNFLEEIAKYRAARRLHAKTMQDRYDPHDPRSMEMRFHVQTGGVMLTQQQPENNIARATFHALAAVLGGAQSIHVTCYDEALALPTEKAVELALRTQQIIAHETGVADTIDPVGGSFYIEWMTNQIEGAAREYMNRIEVMGGAVAAIGQGYQRGRIEENAYRIQKDIEAKKRVVVGVNEYIADEEPPIEVFRVDPKVAARQHARLQQLRERRDNEQVKDYLIKINNAAKGTNNLMPLFIEAVEHNVTLGEICKVLRDVWGEYQATT